MFESRRADDGDAAAFMARWPAAPPRFAAWAEGGHGSDACAAAEGACEAGPGVDDLWTLGFAAGRAEAQLGLEREADAMDALLRALDRLAPVPSAVLAERLAREVRALLFELVGTATVDETLLVARCAALADMAETAGAAVLHAHPDDAALLMAAQPAVTIIADDRLPRCELLLIDGAGEAAAGPRTMLADWAAATGETPC